MRQCLESRSALPAVPLGPVGFGALGTSDIPTDIIYLRCSVMGPGSNAQQQVMCVRGWGNPPNTLVVHVCMYVCMHACMYVLPYVSNIVCIYIYIFIYLSICATTFDACCSRSVILLGLDSSGRPGNAQVVWNLRDRSKTKNSLSCRRACVLPCRMLLKHTRAMCMR